MSNHQEDLRFRDRLVDSDNEAWTKFYLEYKSAFVRRAHSWRLGYDAEDLFEEFGFLLREDNFRRLRLYHGEGPLGAFLWRAAGRFLNNEWKRRKREREVMKGYAEEQKRTPDPEIARAGWERIEKKLLDVCDNKKDAQIMVAYIAGTKPAVIREECGLSEQEFKRLRERIARRMRSEGRDFWKT